MDGRIFPDEQGNGNSDASDQYEHHGTGRSERGSIPANQLAELIRSARRTRGDRLVGQVMLDVHGQTARGLVPSRAILLQTLHDDPIQIAVDDVNQLWRIGLP